MDGVMEFRPLTSENWLAFETLFGVKGACGGCWCMYPRLPDKEDKAGRGEVNHQKMKAMVDAGKVPGLLAFQDNAPIGWISLGPREEFPRLRNSKILAPVDEQSVWSVVCLFIAKEFRRQGVSVELLVTAAEFAKSNGAAILEGYPTDPNSSKQPDAFVWTGIHTAYLKSGFVEVERRSKSRPIMRKYL